MVPYQELAEGKFNQLDIELTRLGQRRASDEMLWAAIKEMVQIPGKSISEEDRRWWWRRFYGLLDWHGLTKPTRPRF